MIFPRAATRPLLGATALMVAVILAAPLVQAHGAPDPAAGFERLLGDINDDCGHGGLNACRNGFDLIAFEIQEKHDASLGDVAVLRLAMDRASTFPASAVMTLGSKSFTITTSDNSNFSGTGVDRVDKAVSLNDGTRFRVDTVVKMDKLGSVGTKLSGFKVDAKVGGNVGDYMPGDCNNSAGACVAPVSGWDTSTKYERTAGYTLRGPTYYVELAGLSDVTVAAGAEKLVSLTLKNKFSNAAQQVTLEAEAGPGATVGFHQGDATAGATYSPKITVALAKGASASVHLKVTGGAGAATVTVTLHIDTDLGGHDDKSFRATVGPGGSKSSSSTTTPAKGGPAPAFALAGLALLSAARIRSRRA